MKKEKPLPLFFTNRGSGLFEPLTFYGLRNLKIGVSRHGFIIMSKDSKEHVCITFPNLVQSYALLQHRTIPKMGDLLT
jgi:hypothetical protein